MEVKPHLRFADASSPVEEPDQAGRLSRLVRSLSRRKVCRTAISYVLIIWLNLQIGDVIFPMIGIPEWSLSLIIMIGIMGFPVVLILSWAFQITPSGIVLDTGAHAATGAGRASPLQLGVDILLLVTSLVLSSLLIMQFTADGSPGYAAEVERSRYVLTELHFEAARNENVDHALAAAVAAEVRSQIIAQKLLPIVPHGVAVAENSEDERTRLSLVGSVIVDGRTARMLAQLVNSSDGVFVTAVAFSVQFESVLDAELKISERLMKTLARFGEAGGTPLEMAAKSALVTDHDRSVALMHPDAEKGSEDHPHGGSRPPTLLRW